MDIPAIVQVSVAAFILVSWGMLTAISARFFLNVRSARIEFGIGPQLFILHLNRFTYRINLVPAFIGEVRVNIGKLQWFGIFMPTVAGLRLLGLGPLVAAIVMGSRLGTTAVAGRGN